MKKFFVVMVLSCCITFSVLAQSTDSFFSDYYDVDSRGLSFPEFPDYHGNQGDDNQTPLEPGIVVFLILGIGYVTIKRACRCRQ